MPSRSIFQIGMTIFKIGDTIPQNISVFFSTQTLLFYTEIFYPSEFQNFLTHHKYINQYFDLDLKDFSNSLCTTVAHVLVIDSAYKKTDICTIATRVQNPSLQFYQCLFYSAQRFDILQNVLTQPIHIYIVFLVARLSKNLTLVTRITVSYSYFAMTQIEIQEDLMLGRVQKRAAF